MKKILLLAALLCGLATFSQRNDEPSNADIDRIIMANRDVNKKNAGITDPDKIEPGQMLNYVFTDGSTVSVMVTEGQSQWAIVKQILKLEKVHGVVVPADQSTPAPGGTEVITPPVAKQSGMDPWLFWSLIAAALVLISFLIMYGRRRAKAKKQQKEEQTGNQQQFTNLVPGGVHDAQAPAYMQAVARRAGPNVRIVGPTEKGRVTTTEPIEVSYVEGTKMESFINEPFYRALAEVNNAERRYLYFREICGNDAKSGRIMAGGEDVIIFTPDEVQSEELQTANQTLQPEPVRTEITHQLSGPASPEQLTQLIQAASENMKGTDAGKFTLKGFGVEIELEYSKGIPVTINQNHKETAETTTSAGGPGHN